MPKLLLVVFGLCAAIAGSLLLYGHHVTAGTIVLGAGCLSLGWSMGGGESGPGGYGGSDS